MKTIKLKSLKIVNFKGIRDLTVEFNPESTNIIGDNATCKSTIGDAFFWLMFGKNMEDSKNFSVKTLDENNNSIPKLSHEVTGIIDVDGVYMTIKRVFLEKWVKRRGEDFEEFKGHETKLFIDDVPMNVSEFNQRIESIIPEKLSKLLMNPLYFNKVLDWNGRRKILSEMAGEIALESIALNLDFDAQYIIDLIKSGKDLSDEIKKIKHKKSEQNKELKDIPSRIDELQRMKNDSLNEEEINSEIDLKEKELESINESINDKSKLYRAALEEQNKKRLEKTRLQSEYDRLKIENNQKHNDRSEIQKELNQERLSLQEDLNFNQKINSDIVLKDSIRTSKRTQFDNVQATSFNRESVKDTCPTCRQSIQGAEEKRQELENNFNADKAAKIEEIRSEGLRLKTEIEELQATLIKEDDIQLKRDKIKELEMKLNAPMIEAPDSQEMILLLCKRDEIQIDEIEIIEDSELKLKQKELNDSINDLKQKLSSVEQSKKLQERISELEKQQRNISQEIALLEQKEFQLDKFEKTRVEIIESRVNSFFVLAKFKMFEDQINGGIKDSCVCVVDGVPFEDLNSAMKIKSGIDIVNALQHFYGINCPLIVDNAESVTSLIETRSQLIKMTVEKNSPLTVVN